MDCPSLVTSELFYRSSCKRYSDLMSYMVDTKVHELILNPAGLFFAGSNTYISTALKEQILFLMEELLRVHKNTFKRCKKDNVGQYNLFLKKKSIGLLRLDSPSQMEFYKEGVLDLSITGDKKGLLYVYTPDSTIHVNYAELSYFLGTFN